MLPELDRTGVLGADTAARDLIAAARECLAANDTVGAVRNADEAVRISRSATTLRAAIRLIYDAADVPRAASLLEEFESALGTPGPADRRLIEKVRGRARMIEWVKRPPARRTTPAVERLVVNLLAYSLPYSSVGYATRSHGLARGIREAGWEILPYTRLGFPYDQFPELRGRPLPEEDVIDGIKYRRLFDSTRRDADELGYIQAAVDCYRRVFESTRPAIVHAASNHVTGLPALVAAHQCGIPFIYEVRGFWEVTRSSSDPEFAQTPTYRHIRLFETLVARHSDHVITLTEGMRRELVSRGIPEERISIVPNAVDTERFAPRPRDEALAAQLGLPADEPVIGYVGSFVDYEGLDDLVAAAAMLAGQGGRFRLLLVGDGPTLPELRKTVEATGLARLHGATRIYP
ncbi:MAG TPA: glycosyltransferase [Steroidobacter sp.]